ncbi:MAG: CAP domain-containing protein [Ilumatobacteraceae bacterium]
MDFHRTAIVRRCLVAAVAAATVLPAIHAASASASSPAGDDWLSTVNQYRAIAGLDPVTEDPAMSAGAYQHSCYMLQNGMSHDELPGKPGYTTAGDEAGNSGNVAVSSVFEQTERSHVELWMTGPFHAMGVLRPNLTTVGFGKCDDAATAPWKSGATLDVIRGLGPAAPRTAPILFPGDGSTTSLDRFIAETPDPRTYCGWGTAPAGLPLLAMMPEPVTGSVSAAITGPDGAVETCALWSGNTDGVAKSLLQGDSTVIAMPRNPLAPGRYTATVTTQARTVSWSFTIDPTSAGGSAAPVVVPTAAPSATGLTFQPMTPVRVTDTRDGFGAGRLAGQQQVRVQIAGVAGVPAKAKAISANFTATQTAGAGYLTVWNCSADRPVASTVNFAAGDTVPNAASVPLDADGGLCVFSPVDTDLVIDVNGVYTSQGSARFASIVPVRLMDTREGLGGSSRLAAGQTVALQVAGRGGVPAGSKAVVMNVTSVDAATDGFVTAYPCDQPRPLAAALNPKPGQVRPNLVISPVAADGTVCFFSLNAVDLVVDATGYLTSTSTAFTTTAPFRFTDTRESRSADLNAGTAGRRVGSGQTIVLQVAGRRGVPSGVKAVSVNIAVTDATGAGFLTAFPCGDRPTTSNVNYDPTKAVSTGGLLPLSGTGQLCLFASSSAHVVVDVNGWWS